MSLQVWLPLNGDLTNNGLNNLLVTNNNATIDNSGKIGKCYSFNGTNNYLHSNYNFYNNTYSVCAWIYSTSSSATQTICCDRTAVGSGFSIFLIGGKLRIDAGGNNLQWTTSYTYPINIWFHLAITYNGTNVSYYINGEYKETKVQAISSSYWGNVTSIGASQANGENYGNYLNGKLNDIRIYDHALSAKEVEEISKGLILHYKLDNNGLGGNNFLGNSNAIATTIAPWTNWGTVTSRSIEQIDGKSWFHLVANGENYGGYAQNSYSRNGYNDIDFKPNTDYTISATWFASTTASCRFWFHMRSSEGGANISQPSKNLTVTTTPTRFTFTFNSGSNTDYTINRFGLMMGTLADTPSGTDVYFTDVKMEEGSIATPWSPNPADLGIDSLIVYDCSGYGNNGEIINAPKSIVDTNRYKVCTHFSATDQHIKTNAFNTSGFANSYSFAWWEKISSVSPMHWGFSDGNRLNGMYTGRLWNTGDGSDNPLYNPGTTTQVTAPTVNVWHHWVMTGDGNKCQVYQDGVLWAEAKTYKAITGTTIYLNGWANSTQYCSDNASISDFRIYSTALTANQVKELYNTSVTIDNLGNIYSREYDENDNLNITKTGIFGISNIYDNNELTKASILKADKQVQGNTLYEY